MWFRIAHMSYTLVLAATSVACVNRSNTALMTPNEPWRAVRASIETPSPVMTVRGRVVLPVGLVSFAGGALITNNSGGLVHQTGQLISNNAGGLIAGGTLLNSDIGRATTGKERGRYWQMQTGFARSGIDERPVSSMSVALADAQGNLFRSLRVVQSDADGVFEIPMVPRGLTYTVQARAQTPKGALQVSSLVASDKPVTVSLASTIAVEKLKQTNVVQWGQLNEATFERFRTQIATSLKPEDEQLAFVSTPTEQKARVFERIKTEKPELVTQLDSLAGQIAQISPEAKTIASKLRDRPAISPSPVSIVESAPSVMPSTAPTLTPTDFPSPWTVLAVTLAGSIQGFADGTQGVAQFSSPWGVVVDGAGNVYVADTLNHRIRKVSPGGEVTTLAGSTEGYADGTGTAAQFKSPYGVTVDGEGNVYVADTFNHRIRKVSPGGEVTTLAGSTEGWADGTGALAKISFPYDVTLDGAGNVYVASATNHRIRKVSPVGEVTSLAGSLTYGSADGIGAAARFFNPAGVAVDGSGNVYVADSFNHRIRRVSPVGEVSTLAGSSKGFADGPGTTAQFNNPLDVAVDSAGNVYVADEGNHRIRKVTPAGAVTTLVGAIAGYADGTDAAIQFKNPRGVAVDGAGNVYVADRANHRIRKVQVSAGR